MVDWEEILYLNLINQIENWAHIQDKMKFGAYQWLDDFN